ncbi:aminodeoxychorismate/anthranilate synthase component II [Longispora albida]|uniref:aminodeoxychorismate/anthranilate synthase component II n=1 Tax=Longispora albida TaxID=203523 RepID=UPI00037E4312|nr:aminodeoxychorismate/anthranilate synthase component II [Longispora albida]
MKILVVDNYDSFVHNIVQYLGQLGAECVVRHNDQVSLAEVEGMAGVLLSPGPGTPDHAGICVPLVRRYAGQLPILGVCLGHQAIAAAYGGVVERAPELLHGMTSEVHHSGTGVLAGLPDPFTATRYHSLSVRPGTLPEELEVTGHTTSGVIMALRHRELPLEGVQFHPESVLSQGGHQILANWLAVCGYPAALARVPELAADVERVRLAAWAEPDPSP